ncbi:hypothetical protein [Arthrobacter sp. B1805]|uniref:hypothetical protein n=1 Tax=Arthrobacter sp. B1805 TaxID=2058892 RepID=UPI000CE2C619|nr:hypothetical protein [Arthrobacter sp. B1805]
MNSLFSHQPAANGNPQQLPDLHTTVVVPAPGEHAWAGLTEHLHLWWPAEELSRWGADSFFDLEDNALVETSAEDDENVWGEVVDGQPGKWLELRWHHVGSASTTTVVRLEMEEADRSSADAAAVAAGADGAPSPVGTALTLHHSGWMTSDPEDVYDFYRQFWPDALSRYRRFMGAS